MNDERSDAVSPDSSQLALMKIRQRFEELKKRLGEVEELTPEEQDAFETKFHNAVQMKKWIE